MRDILHRGKWLELGGDNAEGYSVEYALDPSSHNKLGQLHCLSATDSKYLLLVGPWAASVRAWKGRTSRKLFLDLNSKFADSSYWVVFAFFTLFSKE